MAKARFVYSNQALAATMTASASATARPAANLNNPARWKLWRSSTTTGDQNIVADFGSAKTIKAISLVDWLGHAGGVIRADYWDGATWVAFGTFTLPAFNPTKVITLWNTAGVSTSKVRIYFTNTATVSAYVEIGALVAGDYYQPTYTIVDGFQLEPVDPSLIVESVDGQEEAQARTGFHVAEGSFVDMPEADFDAFRVMFAANGRRKPLIFAIDPDDQDEVLYCRLNGMPIRHSYGDNWSIAVGVRESR